MSRSFYFFRSSAFGLVLLLFLFCPKVPADRVFLKNGGMISGQIVEEAEELLSIRSELGVMSIHRKEIERLERTSTGESHSHIGHRLFQQGQLEAAYEEFQKALEDGQGTTEAQRGMELIREEIKARRRQRIQTATETARKLSSEGNFKQALAILDTLLETYYPDDREIKHIRGEIRLDMAENYLNHFQMEYAKQSLLLAARDGGPASRLHQLLGVVDMREGRLNQAFEEFLMARASASERERIAIGEKIEQTEKMLAAKQQLHQESLREQPTGEEDRYGPSALLAFIEAAARKFDIDPLLVEAVIMAESGFRPAVVSPAGAVGLMQLMPGTASDMGVTNPFDPEQNIFGGARYLAMMLSEFDGNVEFALAAYNAGPLKVKIYKGVPPYRETRAYIPRVMNQYSKLRENGSSLSQTLAESG